MACISLRIRIALIVLLLWMTLHLAAQTSAPVFTGEKRIYHTVPIRSPAPEIDGVLDDACWLEGEWAGSFRQNMPAEGAPPSQRTEFKLLYDNENIYVAIRAYDNEPDKIDRQMTRRDERLGDIVGINFDSYHDRRTGFEFDLTAAGCKLDLIMTNEGFDTDWNPVWDGKTGRMDSGWTAEMKIPLSQLRYGNQQEQVWGLHAWRWINRNRESDHWNLIPRGNAGLLYYFGELQGLHDLPRIRRMEFMPYVLAKAETYPKEAGNPYRDGFDPSASIGLDGKSGLGSNFTVDYTVNPDFGQVEADPSELNLSAFETYYEEKRPFFIEGRNIFDYSFDNNQLFYSRRIGHLPSYEYDTLAGEKLRQPDFTSILGAVKLTGKSNKGLSVGIMESLTAREYATIHSMEGERHVVAEPLTNYFAGRVQQDINQSNTIIGAMVTSTVRDIDHDYLNFLSRSATTGGVDLMHYLFGKSFYISFKALGTHIEGSPESITELEKASTRYYQRPDAPHLKLDTTLTKLNGYGGILEFVKGANGHWRYGVGSHWSSQGMELNDIGFQNTADEVWEGQMAGYVENEPKGIFRTYDLTLAEINYWNFGGEFLFSRAELEGNALFDNKWGTHTDFQATTDKTLNTRLLRGGPGVYEAGTRQLEVEIFSDESRKLSGETSYEHVSSVDHVSYDHQITTELTWKATTSMVVSAKYLYHASITDLQFIEDDAISDAGKYVMGRLDRKTSMITFRLSYAVTPEFTIQYYGSPYISAGKYNTFKTLADESAKDPANVFHSFSDDEITYDESTRNYTVNDWGVTFQNPDFNFREFRSNLVARWEYRPGSVLYLVWTNNRSTFENEPVTSAGRNLGKLFSEASGNVFLLKFSYWFSR
jgi:hypothetical protein